MSRGSVFLKRHILISALYFLLEMNHVMSEYSKYKKMSFHYLIFQRWQSLEAPSFTPSGGGGGRHIRPLTFLYAI